MTCSSGEAVASQPAGSSQGFVPFAEASDGSEGWTVPQKTAPHTCSPEHRHPLVLGARNDPLSNQCRKGHVPKLFLVPMQPQLYHMLINSKLFQLSCLCFNLFGLWSIRDPLFGPPPSSVMCGAGDSSAGLGMVAPTAEHHDEDDEGSAGCMQKCPDIPQPPPSSCIKTRITNTQPQ